MRCALALRCYTSAVLLGGCWALRLGARDGPAAPAAVPGGVAGEAGGGAAAGGGGGAAPVGVVPTPWWREDANTQMLQIPPTWRHSLDRTGGRRDRAGPETRPEKEVTAIVTHAGKNSQEFIDMAVMLAVSLKRHVPDYPRFAIAVRGITETNQETLAKAGWTVVLVDDWMELQQRENASLVPLAQMKLNGTTGAGPPPSTAQRGLKLLDLEAIPDEDRFFWRWADVFEKLNMFRLPFGRVLYLDADTYVMSDQLDFLLNSTTLPNGNIGMVHDGCKTGPAQDGEYNSGVMLFKPHRGMFTKMLKLVGGVMSGALEARHDQPIINEVYKGRVSALDRKYNCIDLTGRTAAAECAQKCNEVVVTHFTGLPKPATADEKFLDIVRRPHSPILHCFNTNHGSCGAWSEYYCDVHQNRQALTKRLQDTVEATGGCCHSPRQADDPPECRDECPSQVKVDGWMPEGAVPGVFNKTNLPSDPVLNAGRPIYAGPALTESAGINGSSYMWYMKPYGNWVIGLNYKTPVAWTYSHERASCPSDTSLWKRTDAKTDVNTMVSVVSDSPIAADMVLDLKSGSGEWMK
ncbi:unnamed protein product [Prorocentrum cordatum]|uniref:Uncharacterized protein n=1 Tax=Prorocentrum cordatum TaxID=2364126 RepID=A0ABN9UFL5_9DINO|nr:unnamed protein product [Polarella glacialis]